MKITYLNTGDSVGNEFNWSSPIVIPIGKGLKQELMFEEMGAVTSMTIDVYRAGVLMYQQTPVPSATMRIDLSVFAQVLPSLLETYKYSGGNPSGGVQEYVQFTIQDGVTQRIFTVYVCSVPAPNLISYGFSNDMGVNRCSASASTCDISNFSASSGVGKAGHTSNSRGVGTRVVATNKGAGTLIGTLNSGLVLQNAASVYTHGVHVENTGTEIYARFSQIENNGTTNVAFYTISKGFRGTVYHTFNTSVAARYNIEFYASVSGNVDFTLHTQMLNRGGFMPWVRSGVGINTPCVGAMTDYRSGKCNVLDTANTLGVRDTFLAGARAYSRCYFNVGSQNVQKVAFVNGVNVGGVWSGTRDEDHFLRTVRLANYDGSLYGWIEYERKLVNPPLPTCSVLARWLNTKGWYDTMLFEKFTVKPIIDNLQNNEYEVTVQAESNWDNEPCLEWLQRSPDIVMRIPNDITQMGLATLTSTNVFTNVGGEKKKVFQYKFNVKLQKA